MKRCTLCDKTYPDEGSTCSLDGAPLSSGERLDPLLGRNIKGRYRILSRLGEGGMGSVYLAEQLSIARKVALKVLHREFARDSEFVQRFHQEARLAASLNHPRITTIFDFDQDEGGSLFIVMEYLQGTLLSELIRREGALDVRRAVRLAIQIADGLTAAHGAGVIHRDVKPQNVMVLASGDAVKLMDFGIARIGDTQQVHLTRAGTMMGTPSYMAPEQIEGRPVSAKTDIYAFGVVFYEMLTGTPPFSAPTTTAMLAKHLSEPPTPVRSVRSEVSPLVEQVVMQALEKDPEWRQEGMADIARRLRAAGGLPAEPASMPGPGPSTIVVAPSPGSEPHAMTPTMVSPSTMVSPPTMAPSGQLAPPTLIVSPPTKASAWADRARHLARWPVMMSAGVLVVLAMAVWLLSVYRPLIPRVSRDSAPVGATTSSPGPRVVMPSAQEPTASAPSPQDKPQVMTPIPASPSNPVAAPTAPVIAMGTLAFRSPVDGVEVFLGDQRIGKTEAGRMLIKERVGVGRYRIKASKAGYTNYEREVQVAADQRAEVVIDIQPLGPENVVKGDDGAEMVLVRAGEFWMGSVEEEVERLTEECKRLGSKEIQCRDSFERESPRHRVFLNAFYVDRYEITNALYRRCVQSRACKERTSDAPPDHPVVDVSWHDAVAYCRWAGKRQPTEAEWEKAARGTDGRRYPWGERWDTRRANSSESGKGTTVAVGSHSGGASPYGAHDMAGNVWEWVADWYDKDYYKRSSDRNPRGPEPAQLPGVSAHPTHRVLRGGSWFNDSFTLRTAGRSSLTPDNRNGLIGFRCARDP